ncbi:MAG TPA: hypothetical protein VHD86_10045, partial [Xanthobacteraceae bacterium]|nr:hypothetical protein [Xanthobacteraceae bacterium]
MSSAPSIASADVSAKSAVPTSRPPASTGGQQADSQPFADLLDAEQTQQASAPPTPPPAASTSTTTAASSPASGGSH